MSDQPRLEFDFPSVRIGAAIIYDFARKNTIYPDESLGRAALRAAKNGSFPLGTRGAGTSATVGKGLRFAYRE